MLLSATLSLVRHVEMRTARVPRDAASEEMTFEAAFRREFDARFAPLARYLARLVGEPESAADLAQEAFVRLFQRGSMPDDPAAWLVSVAHNLLRNERTQITRRLRLLEQRGGELAPRDSGPAADAALDARELRVNVRRALDALPERERQMLLLRYEGFSYREIAHALAINETSVGTLLARAKVAFRDALGGSASAEVLGA
ncbi:MAG TPA: sigma-70 family RNA polymerase sigma factor [Gemmatimonadaceae bacterium]|nr:sigma-70 family RNA polymerase sigma factor [Gemmatimonadaceae bacterium]